VEGDGDADGGVVITSVMFGVVTCQSPRPSVEVGHSLVGLWGSPEVDKAMVLLIMLIDQINSIELMFQIQHAFGHFCTNCIS
jgi:hypothetical protein